MLRHFICISIFVLYSWSLVSAQTVNHGYISNINRQTSPNFLSFRVDVSALTDLSTITAYYAFGITESGTELLDWKQISSLQATQTITQVMSQPIAADFPIYITLRLDDSSTSTSSYYSSSTLKVGDRVSTDPSCSAIWNPVGTAVAIPPQPTFNTVYNGDEQKFYFEVVTSYALQGFTWVVDFAPFTSDHTKGVKGLAATNCENRAAADLTGRQFAEFWNAAPAANWGPGLNSLNYLSYRHGSVWSVSAVGCDKVKYTSNFSFFDLLSCKKADGTTPSILRSIVGTDIHYNGTVYVTAVKPVNATNHLEGFYATQFAAPFFVSFSVSSTSISSGTSSNVFEFTISSLNIQDDGTLALSLLTNTLSASYYLTTAVISAQPDDIGLEVVSPIPGHAQTQLWKFATSVASNDYSGSYQIDWSRTNGAVVQTVSATFALELTVPQVYNNDSVPAVVLPSSVGFENTNPDGSPKTEFTTYDEIFVTSTVNVANNQDLNTYTNSIYNVWICYTVDGSLPVYAPDNGFYGCTTQTWMVRPVARLVYSGQVMTGALEDQFYTTLYTNVNNAPNTAGVSFRAAPLALLRSGQFFIQVESRINLPAKKRANSKNGASYKISSFTIKTAEDIAPGGPQDPTSSSSIIAHSAIIIASCSVFLI